MNAAKIDIRFVIYLPFAIQQIFGPSFDCELIALPLPTDFLDILPYGSGPLLGFEHVS
jgi:hypothetical protein